MDNLGRKTDPENCFSSADADHHSEAMMLNFYLSLDTKLIRNMSRGTQEILADARA